MQKPFWVHRCLFFWCLPLCLHGGVAGKPVQIAAKMPSIDLARFSPYLVYYGAWDEAKIKQSHDFRLAIVHPGETGQNLSAEIVQGIQKGRDGLLGSQDDVKVLLYISLGETRQVTRGLRTGQGIGPCYRDERGTFIYAKLGFESWYLDETQINQSQDGQIIWGEDGVPQVKNGRDGLPDENGKWGSFFVRAGDEGWHLQIQQLLRSLRRFNADGYFLDTIDTASPWGAYGWMQEEMAQLILNLRSWAPKSILVMNRGLFLFEKWGKELSQAVNGLMFESYVSEWNWHQNVGQVHPWYSSNRSVLEQQLWPAQKNSKLAVLFLNYYDPLQVDAPGFNYIQSRDAQGLRSLFYVTSPDLQQLNPPFRPQILKNSPLSSLVISWRDRQIAIEIPSGKGLPLVELQPAWENIQAPFIPQSELKQKDGLLYLPELASGNIELNLTWLGDDGQPQWRFQQQLMIPPSDGLDLGWPKANLMALDGQIEISWEKISEADGLMLQWGSAPDQLLQKQIFETSPVHQQGFVNGQTYYGRVARMVAGRRGPWSRMVTLNPHDCTPPKVPKISSAKFRGNVLELKFKAPEDGDFAGFLLAFEQDQFGFGLPLQLPKQTANYSLPWPKTISRLRFKIYSYDESNNASPAVFSDWLKTPDVK